MFDIRPLDEADRSWQRSLLSAHFGGPRIASRGAWFQSDALPGLTAWRGPERAGFLAFTPEVRGHECEIIALVAAPPRFGVGSALLGEMVRRAAAAGVSRLFLTTSNDNLDALRFYQRRGWRIVAVHPGSIERARAQGPHIPLVGHYGLPIRDDIELQWPGLGV